MRFCEKFRKFLILSGLVLKIPRICHPVSGKKPTFYYSSKVYREKMNTGTLEEAGVNNLCVLA